MPLIWLFLPIESAFLSASSLHLVCFFTVILGISQSLWLPEPTMLSWAPITWKSFSLYLLSLCLMGNTAPALPALSLLAPWVLLYCKSTLVCWVPITWKETPLLYYLEHFSLTSLSIHLGMPYIVILVTRTLSLLPLAIFSIPPCSQLPPGAFLPVPRSCLFCLCPSHWFTGAFCCFTVPLCTYESTRLESSLGWSSFFLTLSLLI